MEAAVHPERGRVPGVGAKDQRWRRDVLATDAKRGGDTRIVQHRRLEFETAACLRHDSRPDDRRSGASVDPSLPPLRPARAQDRKEATGDIVWLRYRVR